MKVLVNDKYIYLSFTYIKLDTPGPSAFERRGHGVQILAPEREELLHTKSPGRVVTDVGYTVLLTNRHQTVVHVEGELGYFRMKLVKVLRCS